jgi:hypothetical protein
MKFHRFKATRKNGNEDETLKIYEMLCQLEKMEFNISRKYYLFHDIDL